MANHSKVHPKNAMTIESVQAVVDEIVEPPFSVKFFDDTRMWEIMEDDHFVLQFWVNAKSKTFKTVEFRAPHYGDVGWWIMFKIQYALLQEFGGGTVYDGGVGRYTPTKDPGSFVTHVRDKFKGMPILGALMRAKVPRQYHHLGKKKTQRKN